MKKILIGTAAIALMALLMVGTASACVYGPGLSPGFWKHNLGVYLGLEKGAYSDPINSPYVSKDTMATWLGGADPQSSLTYLYNQLSIQGGGAAGAAARLAAANVLNADAGLSNYVE